MTDAPRYIVDPLPEIVAITTGGQWPVGSVGPPVLFTGDHYESIPCDGREYDPDRYPLLHAIMQRPVKVRRWRWWPFAHRTVIRGRYGDNRVPDLRGRVIIP